MSMIDLNIIPSPDNLVIDINHNAKDLIIDLNRIPEETEEALPEEELMFMNNEPIEIEPNVYDLMDRGYGYDTVVFIKDSTQNLLPPGRGKGHAPIPSSVRLQTRPDWLPIGWWIDYRVRPLTKIIYKNYIDPVTGRKFRSKKEVERYLDAELVLEGENAHAANPNQEPRVNDLAWGTKRKRSGTTEQVRRKAWGKL